MKKTTPKKAPKERPAKEETFLYSTIDISDNTVAFQARQELIEYEKKYEKQDEEMLEYDIQIDLAFFIDGKSNGQNLKTNFSKLLKEHRMDNDLYYSGIIKDWEKIKKYTIKKAITAALQEIKQKQDKSQDNREQKTVDKPLADKIHWNRDIPESQLTDILERLKSNGFINYDKIKKVISGEEIPQTAKLKGKGKKDFQSELRNIMYIFMILNEENFITGFIDKKDPTNIEFQWEDYIYGSFYNSRCTHFRIESFSDKRNEYFRVDELKNGIYKAVKYNSLFKTLLEIITGSK